MARDTSPTAVTDSGDAGPHGLPGGLQHLEILRPGLTDYEAPGRITMPSLHHGAEIDGNEIAVADHAITGDTVNQFVVHGDAGDTGKRYAILGAVSQEIRGRAPLREHCPAHRIDLGGRDAHCGSLLHPAQPLGHNQPRGAHFQQLFGRLDLDRHLRPCAPPLPQACAAALPRRFRFPPPLPAAPVARSGRATVRSGRHRPPCGA